MSTASVAPGIRRAPARGRAPARAIAGEQLLVAAGQGLAGVGNLVFALLAARLLEPGAFAHLAAFLALYLVVHVPAASLSAGSALAPGMARSARRRALGGGLLAGALLAGAGLPLAATLGLPPLLVLVVAAAAPGAGLLALERGRLYGEGRHVRAAATLLAEPVLRLGAGVPLAELAGPAGGAAGVVAGGYAALALALAARAGDARRDGGAGRVAAGATPGMAVAAFLLLAVVQNQDVLLANALLPSADAGRFAVLSTLGGAAAFATTTVPLVLLPRAGARHALAIAVLVASALGALVVAAASLDPAALVGSLFGERYAGIASLVTPYVLAMAIFGVARVLVADCCSVAGARPVVALLALVAAAQAGASVAWADSPAELARITLAATCALAATSAAVVALRPSAQRPARSRALRLPSPRTGLVLAGLTLFALAVRLAATRGIWLDEAISIHQATLPWGEMLADVRATDVHPPLHHAILWVAAHTLGTSELAMRLPSMLAGALLLPATFLLGRELYGRRTGFVAAAFVAVAPLLIWYSQEARMYALFMLFAVIAVWAQIRALRDGRPRHWALYALATAAMAWTQYFALLVIGVQQLGFLLVAVRRARDGAPVRGLLLGWAGALAAVAVALLPLIPILQDQLAAYGDRGQGLRQVPSQAGAAASPSQSELSIYAVIANLVWAVWGYHPDGVMAQIVALWPLGMLVALLLLGRGRSPATLLVVAVALVPALALFALGLFKRDLFEIRYFMAASPLLLLLLARAVTSWAPRRAVAAGATVLVAGTLVAGLTDQQLNGTNPRNYEFDEALAKISERARPGDVLAYEPEYLEHVVDYYAPEVRAAPLEAVGGERHRGRVIVLGSFLDKPVHAARTGEAVSQLRRKREQVGSFEESQVKVWVFE